MSTYDLSIMGGTLCGLIMVVGGIFLLSKGAIKLEAAAKDPALTVELFEKQFKLTTQVPALGLFVIGLLFIGLSIYVARGNEAAPIRLVGKTGVVDQPIFVQVRSEWLVPAVLGQVDHVLRPQLDILWITIKAPGYAEFAKPFSKDELKNGINFGDIKMQRIALPPVTRLQEIAPLPAGVTPPPLDAEGEFGRSRNP